MIQSHRPHPSSTDFLFVMPDVEPFLDALRDELVDLAENRLQSARDAAIQDGEAFLASSKEDLKRWSRLLAEGKLSEEEFQSLVEGKKDLAETTALKQAGLAAVEIDRFRQALIDRIVDTAFRAFI